MLMNCSKPDLDPTGMELEGGVPFGKKQLSMKRVDANKASEHPGMKKFINQVKGKSIKTKTIGLANQRNVNEIQTFKLQMTDIVMIEKAGYTSFTFAVIKDDDQGKMENIIVNYYSNGDVKSYLVMYDVNEAEREMLRQGIMVSLDDKTETYLLENFIDQVGDENTINSAMYDFNMCAQWTTTVSECKSTQHNISNFQECDYFQQGLWNPFETFTTLEFVPCLGVGGGPSWGDGIVTPPGDTGGGGSNPPDNNVNPEEEEEEDELYDDGLNWNITYPVPPKVEPHVKNCEKLAEMVANTGIRNSLNFLKNQVAQSNREYGFGVSLDPNVPIIEAQLANGSDTEIIMPVGGQIYGFIHIHPFQNSQSLGDPRNIPMFSLSDIFGFARLIVKHNNPNADPSIFFLGITVKNAGGSDTFIIKIENKQAFINWAQSFNSLSEEAKGRKARILGKEYENRLNNGGGASGYLKEMLTFMKSQNIKGLGVYKATDENFSGWKKMVLDQNNNVSEDGLPCD